MFDEIRYELDGVEIDRSRNVGITNTIKNFVSLITSKSVTLENGTANWKTYFAHLNSRISTFAYHSTHF